MPSFMGLSSTPSSWLLAVGLLLGTVGGAAAAAAGEFERLALPADAPELSSEISEQELVGVYADGFSASWVTAQPADSTVCILPENQDGWCEAQESDKTDHLVNVSGLQPGTGYRYWLLSAGRRARPVEAHPEALTTLTLPPGEHVADVVILNDIHIGEPCSGELVNLGGTSIPGCTAIPLGGRSGEQTGRMLQGASEQIRALHPALVLVNGDLTDAGAYTHMRQAQSLLDGLGIPYEVTRGNHDRPNQGGEGEAQNCGATRDCYSTVFRPGSTERVQPKAVQLGNIRFLLLDSEDANGLGDLTNAPQQRWLEQQLAAWPEQRTFILLHHPPGTYSNLSMAPPGNGVPAFRGGLWLQDLVARNKQVVAVIAGHTHRNLLGYENATGRVPWLEFGALKGYPAGFNVLRIYQGGYLREFHRADCADDFCRRWTSVTRRENFGTMPAYMLGELRSRAFTYVDDCDHHTPRLATLPWQVGGDSGQDSEDCRGHTDAFP